MKNGYWYKFLRVDLNKGTIKEENFSENLAKKYIGGAGMAAWYLKREVPPDVNALDPENRLIFTTGPFQATKIPGAAKFSIVSRSPLTGIFADSAAGARWGISFKKCGYDMVIIQGKSRYPVYLYVKDNQAILYDASDLWGKDSREADSILSDIYPGASIATIGPAGENCIAIANIQVDNFSSAGRCGLGAVMGAKKLKAVIVNGSLATRVYDDDYLAELENQFRKRAAKTAIGLRKEGTISGIVPGEKNGNLPLKNFSMVGWEKEAKKIGIPGYAKILKPKPHACIYCPIACHRSLNVTFSDGFAYKGSGPEYETLAMLGANCLIDDLEMLVKINDYCNRMGIDTISAGSLAAFAMEALERGHCGNYKPDYSFGWGNGRGLMKFLEELVHNTGFGGLFSEGIKKVSQIFGDQTMNYACHVKGLDIPAQDPRVYYNLSINYATGNRGACHMRAYSQIATMGALLPEVGISVAPKPNTLEGASHVVKIYQDFTAVYNSCVLCQFMIWGGIGLSDMVKILNAITGWNMSIKEFMECGERIFNFQRLLNIAYGISGKDDTLPQRIFEPSTSGPRAYQTPREGFEEVLKEYYKERGWDEKGIPYRERLASLKIEL
ncbi:MAG TPA: hypothetical protein ENG48_04540 [Candidatus Atribacteria bacterium]|nr:hypothetical protein [Candidatus Atribacteria bacterium]